MLNVRAGFACVCLVCVKVPLGLENIEMSANLTVVREMSGN